MYGETIHWNTKITGTNYPLKRNLTGTYQQNQLIIHPLSPTYTGEGGTPSIAETDLKNKINTDFKTLYNKRPFQMTADERDKWAILESVIDVDAYTENTPLISREIGVLSCIYGEILEIRWISGEEEQIRFESVPSELAGLIPGRWFEAEVKRERGTGRLLEIISAFGIDPIEKVDAHHFWDNMKIIGR